MHAFLRAHGLECDRTLDTDMKFTFTKGIVIMIFNLEDMDDNVKKQNGV